MKQLLTFIVLVCSWHALQAQISNWTLAGTPLEVHYIRGLCVDSANNYLYVGGTITDSALTWQRQSVLRYDGAQWDTLSGLDNDVFGLTVFNEELYVCGAFIEIGGQPSPYLLRHNGVGWEPFGSFNSAVFDLKVLGGELYALGAFDTADGIHARGVAKWDGISWSSLGFDREGIVRVAEIYNGELYVGGTTTHNNMIEDLSVLSGGVWQKVGVGFFGNFNSVNDLQIYEDELYACGLIQGSAGNVGSIIQKWDGVQWTNVGTGLQGPSNDSSSTSQAFDMVIHDDKLYVVGNFDYADHVPAESFASWDGVQWCGYNTGSFLSGALELASFNDTLFMASGSQTGIAFEKNLIKWVGGSFVDVCGPMVGVSENVVDNQLHLYPNPTSNTISIVINALNADVESIGVVDLTGRTVLTCGRLAFTDVLNLDLSALSAGAYLIKVQTQDQTYIGRFEKQ